MPNDNVLKLIQPGAFDDQLTEVLGSAVRSADGHRHGSRYSRTPGVLRPGRNVALGKPSTAFLAGGHVTGSHLAFVCGKRG